MNGHVFECYGESQTFTQFTCTCEELQSYTTIHYKNGSDIQYMIKHFDNFIIVEPTDIDANTSNTHKCIWEKSIDQYVIRME